MCFYRVLAQLYKGYAVLTGGLKPASVELLGDRRSFLLLFIYSLLYLLADSLGWSTSGLRLLASLGLGVGFGLSLIDRSSVRKWAGRAWS